MPIDIEEITSSNFPAFDGDNYVCVRPSRFGALCVHEDALTTLAQSAMSSLINTSQGSSEAWHLEGFSENVMMPSIPLFKFDDSVKTNEKCYVLDWETSTALAACKASNTCNMNHKLESIVDEMMSSMDAFNGEDVPVADRKPVFAFCGENSVDVNYMLTTQMINRITFSIDANQSKGEKREERREEERIDREETREEERIDREETRERERIGREETRERERIGREETRERERIDRRERSQAVPASSAGSGTDGGTAVNIEMY